MAQQEQVRSKLQGENGYGVHAFTEDEADAVRRQLENLMESVTQGMNEETASLVEGISRHIEHGTFSALARRRGGTWRIISALADRVNEFEGLAQIYLAGAAHGTDLARVVPLKVLAAMLALDETEACVDTLGSPKTQAYMERVLDRAREHMERMGDEAVALYWAEFKHRMEGHWR